jgi:hypothetical protein
MKFRAYILAGGGLVAAAFGAVYLLGGHPGGERTDVTGAAAWERMASPGALSRSHAFLEHDCASCHTSTKGPEAAKCIACHADNESLLKRQPTAFHATVGSCRECHGEHQGIDRRPTDMVKTIGCVMILSPGSANTSRRSMARKAVQVSPRRRRS